jgi:hypothetical protein
MVGEEVWTTLNAFMQKPTLEDSFTPAEANAIFRFGQYQVLLKWRDI